MPDLLLSTKLQMPQIRLKGVQRPRLIACLQQGLAAKLILISAPAGYGKTTLLCEWLAACEQPSAWVSLNKGDNDPVRFWAYVQAALQQAIPSLVKTTPDTLREYDLPIPQALITNLINELDRLHQPLILVLDDYHNINAASIHDGLAVLLEHAPTHLHLVLSTRADPPLPLARLRSRSEMKEMRQSDLAFTSQEAADFLQRTMALEISQEDIDHITARTEGWIAGLQMAALSVQNMDDIHGFVSTLSGSHHYIFDYLVEEILKRQSREIQRFLLYTSILDQLTAPLCDALLKEGAVPDITRPSTVILEELEHANLFILPLDHEQRWYRYHHLFSDLLRIMLEKTYPRRCTELHHRACLWYEAHGMLSDALDHALSSGDMKLVAQIVADNALVLVENDAAAPILKQIDALPLDQVTTLPWLGIARAWILGAGQIHKSEQILDAVEKSLEIVPEGCERQRIRGHIAAARAHVLGAKGDFNEALAHVKLAVDLLPEDEIAVRARCLTIWGDLLVGNGNVSQGIPYLEWAWTMAMRAKRPHVSMIAAASLANAYLFQGRMHELEHVCREALLISEIYEQRVQHPMLATSGVYALLARVLAEWGESEEAIPYARMGLRLSQRWGQDLDETFCLDYLARVLVFNNDWEQAKPLLDRAGLLAWKISAAMGLDRTFFTLDSLLDSEFPRPGEVEQEMRRIQVQGASYPALLAARLKLREEQPDQAFTILEQAESELKDQPSFDTIRIYALRALAYQALGNTKQALLALRQALDLGEPENRVATFVREGAVMEKLLRLAQASGMAPRFIQRLLLAFEMRRKHNQKRNLIGKGLVESVSERELDVIKLLAQGCSDKNIAEKLFISPETVHKHLKNIYGKLGVHSRTEALVQARKLELL